MPGPFQPKVIVGVGASAGGLEALELMFDNIAPDCCMAFVVIQHLSPDFRSLMDELLARHTRLSIYRVEDGMEVEANAIYLIPPKKEMIISNGRLLLSDKDKNAQFTLPIDVFFRSLAQDAKSASVGVILSGTGSDGSIGIGKIHEAGGLVIVQSEDSAKFNGMPRSAIETGMADLVVPPEKIGSLISAYACATSREEFLAELTSNTESEPVLQMVFSALQKDHGLDFRQYKPGTMLRRLHRRAMLADCGSVEEYANNIVSNASERRALYEDLLIGVTHFFRDTEMFEALQKEIRSRLEADWKNETIRAWVCGCSTGQEAYTIAMILHDQLDQLGKPIQARIFATDIDRGSLEIAGRGHYDASSMEDIPLEFIRRYFTQTLHGYQVVPEIRQMVTFAAHNALRDAPFTNLHFVTCRNFLIYLNNDAQQKVLALLYFGLKSNGLLFLGSSESVGDLASDLKVLNVSAKIFQKQGPTRSNVLRKPSIDLTGLTVPGVHHRQARDAMPGMVTPELLNIYDILLGDVMSAGILINHEGSVIQVFGDGARYLTIPPGRVSSKLVDLACDDLRLPIIGAVHRVRKTLEPVSINKLRLKITETDESINLIVSPILPKSGRQFILLRFETDERPTALPAPEPNHLVMESAAEHIDELAIELSYTKENLSSTIEELETSNEELQATNEEMIASNEELQSTNEELHSVNEELYTVNAEYQKKIAELTKLNNDFDNLLASTDIHTVFLDSELNIRLFTPRAVEVFNFTREDIGRKFDSFTHKLHIDSLTTDLRTVLTTGNPIEREVFDQRQRSFLLRILPYLAVGKSCGVVISMLDISARVEWERQLRNSNDRFERAIAATRDGIWDWPDIKKEEMWWSPMCYEIIGYEPYEFPSIYPEWIKLIHPEDQERVRQSSVPHQKKCYVELHRNFEYWMLHKSGVYRWYQHRALVVHNDMGYPVKMTGAVVDIETRKELEKSLRDQVRQRDDFLAILSHELRNPLGAVTNAIALLDQTGLSASQSEHCTRVIREQSHHMNRLLDDLLDVSRVSHNKLDMRVTDFDLVETASEVLSSVRSRAEANGIEMVMHLSTNSIRVRADRDRIIQCQVNLLGNAIKFTPRGGKVEYSIRSVEEFAEIEVKDSGVGMSRELSEKIFELFSQGKNEPRHGDSGMGVGLALVRSIAELHSGTVFAESHGLGKGSRFVMRIPTLQVSVHSLGSDSRFATHSPSDQDENASIKKVVIIDDLPDGRSMLAQLLSIQGMQVYEAENGTEGIVAAMENDVDYALIDLGLPDISGHHVALKLREMRPKSPAVLIALTGYGQSKDILQTQASGFDHHLTKPVDLHKLYKILSIEPNTPIIIQDRVVVSDNQA